MEFPKECFSFVAQGVATAALGAVALVALARACRGAGARMRDVGACVKRGVFAAISFVAFLVGAVKNGGGMEIENGELRMENGKLMGKFSPRNSQLSIVNSQFRYDPWTVRGAAEDWFNLEFPEGWVFPCGTNHWRNATVLTSGEIWDTPRGRERVVAVGRQMGAVPFASEFFWEHITIFSQDALVRSPKVDAGMVFPDAIERDSISGNAA